MPWLRYAPNAYPPPQPWSSCSHLRSNLASALAAFEVAAFQTSSAGGERQSVATPQAARERARPPCRPFKLQSASFQGSAFQAPKRLRVLPFLPVWGGSGRRRRSICWRCWSRCAAPLEPLPRAACRFTLPSFLTSQKTLPSILTSQQTLPSILTNSRCAPRASDTTYDHVLTLPCACAE